MKNINPEVAYRLDEYRYELPEDRIATHPVNPRDSSKLLIYRNGEIEDRIFHELPEALPPDAVLVFNNTRVIPCRLNFSLGSAAVEVFALNPVLPELHHTGQVIWEVLVGNRRKWKDGQIMRAEAGEVWLEVSWHNRELNQVQFRFPEHLSVVDVFDVLGAVPIPPYLNRDASEQDKSDYQTVYAKHPGAVAAPTGGLHFTPEVLRRIEEKGIVPSWLTLHVGMGTFKPVTAENILEHEMHEEQFVIPQQLLRDIASGKPVFAVGTTSLRVLESLPAIAANITRGKADPALVDRQDVALAQEAALGKAEAVNIILHWMQQQNLEDLHGKTGIFIYPGFRFTLINGLITNFHQPGSTLLMLIAAWIGEDWKQVYRHALNHGYRFLSYGDSSLLIPNP